MWRQTTKQSANRDIFANELDEFVPDRVLDFHVHVFNEGVIPAGETYSCGGHPITRYDYSDLTQDLAELYPGRQTAAVCFGMPVVGYDSAGNNRYVAEGADGARYYALRLVDLYNDTPDSLAADLQSGRFQGVKPYPDYVRKADVHSVEIVEMLPDWVMEPVHELGLIVMLHIPRRDRLADPVNQRQLVELCKRYDQARVVLAHIGRAYFLKNVIGNLESLKQLPNLYYDLAMVNHWEVIEYLFRTVAQDKVLYATDIPIALAPGKSVEINHQYTYVTPVPWSLSISDDYRRLRFTGFVYEELRAIRHAVERLNLSRTFVEDVFFNNGMALLRSIAS